MDAATLTRERIIAIVIVLAQVAAAVWFSTASRSIGWTIASAIALSLPGLMMIWFRDSLSTTGFDRGVLRESPPLLVDILGWVFLIGLPVMFLYGLLP